MRQINYPTKHDLGIWIRLVSLDDDLKEYLPPTNRDWYEAVVDTIERLQLPVHKKEISNQAAKLFYYIIKNHNFLDGNKRSAIIVVYYFLLINKYYLEITNEGYRKLATQIAKSKAGNSQEIIEDLTEIFKKKIRAGTFDVEAD